MFIIQIALERKIHQNHFRKLQHSIQIYRRHIIFIEIRDPQMAFHTHLIPREGIRPRLTSLDQKAAHLLQDPHILLFLIQSS